MNSYQQQSKSKFTKKGIISVVAMIGGLSATIYFSIKLLNKKNIQKQIKNSSDVREVNVHLIMDDNPTNSWVDRLTISTDKLDAQNYIGNMGSKLNSNFLLTYNVVACKPTSSGTNMAMPTIGVFELERDAKGNVIYKNGKVNPIKSFDKLLPTITINSKENQLNIFTNGYENKKTLSFANSPMYTIEVRRNNNTMSVTANNQVIASYPVDSSVKNLDKLSTALVITEYGRCIQNLKFNNI